MHGIRKHLSYANVMATLAFLIAVAGGTAYAANTIGSSDVIDESLLSRDLKNTEVKVADIGQGAVATDELANGQVKSADIGDGEVRGSDVANGDLTGADVAANSLKGVDIDESTLSSIGGGGPAGGDLSGSYPNPDIAPDAVGTSEVADGSISGSNGSGHDIAAGSIGEHDLDLSTLDMVANGLDTEFGWFGVETTSTTTDKRQSYYGAVINLAENAGFNPSANSGLIYFRDNNGVTQLVARFPNGDIDVLASAAGP